MRLYATRRSEHAGSARSADWGSGGRDRGSTVRAVWQHVFAATTFRVIGSSLVRCHLAVVGDAASESNGDQLYS